MKKSAKKSVYYPLIKKIRRESRIVMFLYLVFAFAVLLVCSSSSFSVSGKLVYFHKGISPSFSALIFFLLILLFGLIKLAGLYTPLSTSMHEECDPEKHLALNASLGSNANGILLNVFSTDYTYMGRFETALEYAKKTIALPKPELVLTGYFNKARCEFFLGDFESLKLTVNQYQNYLTNAKKLKPAVRASYEKILKTLCLLVAIAENDNAKISEYRNIDVWNTSKATQGYVYFLKGVAAYHLNDKMECIYRFMYVKDNCEKTVFAKFAEEYLSKLSDIA